MRRPGLALRLTVLVASALVAGTAVIAVSSRGDLRAASGDVDQAWAGLRVGLDERYQALATAGDAVEQRLGSDGALIGDLDRALAGWLAAGGASREQQVAAANRLEGLVARVTVSASATPRLRSSADVANALAGVAAVDVGDARDAYNQAVARYEHVRGGFPRRLVAGALGFEALRTLEVSA